MRKSPDAYQHGSLASALVEDALVLLQTRTADELSLRELAERAGVSPRAPYVHFPSKKHLLQEVANQGFTQLAEESEAAGFDIYALGEVYLSFATSHPHLFRLMFGGLEIPTDDCPGPGRSFLHLLKAISLANPTLSEAETKEAGLAMWAFVHGLADLKIEGLCSPDQLGPGSVKRLARRLGSVIFATSPPSD